MAVGPVQFWRESSHRSLGHLTACQAAWLPLMMQIRAGETNGSISINPDPLFTKLGLAVWKWEELVERFVSDRVEWRSVVNETDVTRTLQTSRRIWTAQLLTKRLVDHEKRHLDDAGL